MATAIANAPARAEIERLADEQAALRRVATLVAQGAPAAVVFDAVAAEMERLLGADGVTLTRYESDDEVTVVAQSGAGAAVAPAGTRLSLAETTWRPRCAALDGRPVWRTTRTALARSRS